MDNDRPDEPSRITSEKDTSENVAPQKDNDQQQEQRVEQQEPQMQNGKDESPLRQGVCKWFNVLKGWGFIAPCDGSPDVFVHQSVLQMSGFRSLNEGEMLEFRCRQTNQGYEATHVTGPHGSDCNGSTVRPMGRVPRRIRCFNCGQLGNHIAARCRQAQLPKACYYCQDADHLIADCPQRLAGHNHGPPAAAAAAAANGHHDVAGPSANANDRDQPDNKDHAAPSAVEIQLVDAANALVLDPDAQQNQQKQKLEQKHNGDNQSGENGEQKNAQH